MYFYVICMVNLEQPHQLSVQSVAWELSFFIIIRERLECIFSGITLCSRWEIIYNCQLQKGPYPVLHCDTW